jgi:hypothetical protein
LPDGQFWWTHAWNYQRNKLDAIVAFDQANWKSWHELTVCYQAIGWTLVDRQVMSISDAVSVVQASFEKPTHEKATLVFSLFAQNGSLIPPPDIRMTVAREEEADQSFTSLLNGRLTYQMPEGDLQSSNAETFERVLQCQVFAQHHGTLSDEERHGLIELHLETLGRFRNAWLNRQPSHKSLQLVGPWPNVSHEQQIRQLIQALALQDAVSILGRVSNEELHRLYGTSQVFSLMSSCESFGIPAAEAMAFGTPVVSTDCCAIAEVCQPAGQFGPVGDPEWTANALETALTDQKQWQHWSEQARLRAATLTWDNCARAFQKIPELLEKR